jgi:cell wall-associated NlpC family hydrolase
MALMTVDEFVGRAIGLPWVRWRSDWQAADCFGIVILYFRHVLGVELGEVPITDVARGFAVDKRWVECGACAGATVWMGWQDGAPKHVGVLISPTHVLHSDGDEVGGVNKGSARVTRLDALRKLYADSRFVRLAC